mgnify:CR=1 FL=1
MTLRIWFETPQGADIANVTCLIWGTLRGQDSLAIAQLGRSSIRKNPDPASLATPFYRTFRAQQGHVDNSRRRELADLDGDALAGGGFGLGQGFLGRGFIDVFFAAIVVDLGWDVADDHCQGAALEGQRGGPGTGLVVLANGATQGVRLFLKPGHQRAGFGS